MSQATAFSGSRVRECLYLQCLHLELTRVWHSLYTALLLQSPSHIITFKDDIDVLSNNAWAWVICQTDAFRLPSENDCNHLHQICSLKQTCNLVIKEMFWPRAKKMLRSVQLSNLTCVRIDLCKTEDFFVVLPFLHDMELF